ncbi:MAG TPA: DNA-directed RNA polymerase subunit alpha [Candidatus Paceibacterota bacterium]|nr:DNA-directed RNA polymerase subunit alpha [Candidatus Paceibacterota bacterium]
MNVASKDGNKAVVEIGPLMPGFGATIANPLRRVLLSSLQGTAITSIKIKGVDHEFSSIPGVMEDVIQVILNLKKVRFTGYTDDPVELSLSVKGEKTVTAGDIKLTSDVELINPEQVLFTMSDKKASVEMDITVQKGRGYVAVEARQRDKLPIGVIAIDAIYSPVRKVNFSIEDVRVGDRIDYNKIVMEVETDGSMEPEAAVKEAARILTDHFTMVQTVPVPEPKEKPAAKKTAAKKTKKKKE